MQESIYKSYDDLPMFLNAKMAIFTKAGKKQNGSLLYTIRPISEAKQCHVDRQLLENKRREAAQRLASSREV